MEKRSSFLNNISRRELIRRGVRGIGLALIGISFGQEAVALEKYKTATEYLDRKDDVKINGTAVNENIAGSLIAEGDVQRDRTITTLGIATVIYIATKDHTPNR